MQRACDSCGKTYEAKRPSSRYCSDTCRKRAQRGAVKVLPGGKGSPSEPGPLESATLAELDKAERAGSALGRAALALARRVDEGGDTGAGLASLVKQLQATLEAAVEGAGQAADPLDELRRLRDRKRGLAG